MLPKQKRTHRRASSFAFLEPSRRQWRYRGSLASFAKLALSTHVMGFRGRGLSYRPTQLSHSISTGRRRFASESRYGSKRSVSIVVGWRRSPTHGRNPRGAVSIVNASSGRGSHQPAQSILVPEAQTELAKGFNTLEALRTNGACKPDDSYTEGHANETQRNIE